MKSKRSDRVQARVEAYSRRSTRQHRKNTSLESSCSMDEADIQLRKEVDEAEDKTSTDMALALPQGPLDALRSALVTGDFSDLTLVCGDQTFKTHRIIICSQSPVLATLCAESEVRASQIQARDLIHRLSPQFSGLINLTSHDNEAVTKMIEFLYMGRYNTLDISPTFSLHTHAKVHGLALKYQINGLVILSATNFASALRRVRDLEVYFQSIRDVYSLPLVQVEPQASPALPSLDSGNHFLGHALRAEVVDAALVELRKILSSPLVMARFQEICTEVPQFHADFLNALLDAKVEVENAIGVEEGEGALPPLCESCGPRDDGYEIEVRCSGCGKECLYTFH